jgi:hypothetical protein
MLQGICNLAKENLTTEELRKLLSDTDNEGRTVFHKAANFNEIEIFQVIFNLAKKSNNRGGKKIAISHKY